MLIELFRPSFQQKELFHLYHLICQEKVIIAVQSFTCSVRSLCFYKVVPLRFKVALAFVATSPLSNLTNSSNGISAETAFHTQWQYFDKGVGIGTLSGWNVTSQQVMLYAFIVSSSLHLPRNTRRESKPKANTCCPGFHYQTILNFILVRTPSRRPTSSLRPSKTTLCLECLK